MPICKNRVRLCVWYVGVIAYLFHQYTLWWSWMLGYIDCYTFQQVVSSTLQKYSSTADAFSDVQLGIVAFCFLHHRLWQFGLLLHLVSDYRKSMSVCILALWTPVLPLCCQLVDSGHHTPWMKQALFLVLFYPSPVASQNSTVHWWLSCCLGKTWLPGCSRSIEITSLEEDLGWNPEWLSPGYSTTSHNAFCPFCWTCFHPWSRVLGRDDTALSFLRHSSTHSNEAERGLYHTASPLEDLLENTSCWKLLTVRFMLNTSKWN